MISLIHATFEKEMDMNNVFLIQKYIQSIYIFLFININAIQIKINSFIVLVIHITSPPPLSLSKNSLKIVKHIWINDQIFITFSGWNLFSYILLFCMRNRYVLEFMLLNVLVLSFFFIQSSFSKNGSKSGRLIILNDD